MATDSEGPRWDTISKARDAISAVMQKNLPQERSYSDLARVAVDVTVAEVVKALRDGYDQAERTAWRITAANLIADQFASAPLASTQGREGE